MGSSVRLTKLKRFAFKRNMPSERSNFCTNTEYRVTFADLRFRDICYSVYNTPGFLLGQPKRDATIDSDTRNQAFNAPDAIWCFPSTKATALHTVRIRTQLKDKMFCLKIKRRY